MRNSRIRAAAAAAIALSGCHVACRAQGKLALQQLNQLAKTWVSADLAGQGDRKLAKAAATARTEFHAALQGHDEHKVLSRVGDLQVIFDRVFPYGPEDSAGELRRIAGRSPYHLHTPKNYDAATAHASVLVLRGKAAARDYLDEAWRNSLTIRDSVFVLPSKVKGDDFDAVPDLTREADYRAEMHRLGSVLMCLGEVQRSHRLDRRRMFLDCGPGTSGFGLRLATYFPSRFAGIILRHPVGVGSLRLDSLKGLPILMISTTATRRDVDRIKSTLEGLQPGSVTVIEGRGPSPFLYASPLVDLWLRKHRRPLFPTTVTLVPNHDQFHKSHWVDIIRCEALDNVGRGDQVSLEVQADRGRNEIRIKARNVHEIGLHLNDALVDLDQPVTLIVNGLTAGKVTLTRDLAILQRNLLRRYDPTFLYPAYHRLELRAR